MAKALTETPELSHLIRKTKDIVVYIIGSDLGVSLFAMTALASVFSLGTAVYIKEGEVAVAMVTLSKKQNLNRSIG